MRHQPPITNAETADTSRPSTLAEISLRPLTGSDIPAAMELKRTAGWNQTEADWHRYLAVYPNGCLAAVHKDVVVGSVVTACYGSQCAWICMMLVLPEYRRSGIGRRLMEAALANARSYPVVGLDATPLGRPLYAKLGFKDCHTIQRVVNPCVESLGADTGKVRLIRETELPALFGLDRAVFGADRTALLSCLVKEMRDAVFILSHDDRLSGITLARKGSNFTQIGPVIAESFADAQNLVLAAMRKLTGRPVVIDVPDRHSEFRQWLGSVGFAPQRPLWRMFHGQSRLAADLSRQYAIAGPDLG